MPCAITKSQPASTAAIAWRTLPHMLATSTLPSWQQLDDVARHAEPGDEQRRAAARRPCARRRASAPGSAASRSTPNGLSVQLAHRRASRRRARSDAIVAAPSVPKPPASDTAATSARGTRRRPSRRASRGARCRASRSVVSAWRIVQAERWASISVVRRAGRLRSSA